jgi:GTP cyclohydrolase II|tara:strand:- start:495 stop:1088 length:594 start_codon:yes stop_codon:yes gene_type:complete
MNNRLLNFIDSSELPSEKGNFKVHAFTELKNDKDHLAIACGNLESTKPILARIHSQCITGESFFSMRCDCRFQLTESLQQISSNGSGVVFYLQQEGRGIGLSNKIRAYKLQDQGMDTVEANHQLGFQEDERNYEIVASMADHLNIQSVDLMTNNPKKINALEKMGLKVNKRIPILTVSNEHNKKYLTTKAKKLGHLF